jgi:hypothetical protein
MNLSHVAGIAQQCGRRMLAGGGPQDIIERRVEARIRPRCRSVALQGALMQLETVCAENDFDPLARNLFPIPQADRSDF